MLATDSTAEALSDVIQPLMRRLIQYRSLSRGKIGVLSRLAENGPSTASALAVSERITPQAVTMAVRELEELGLVTRSADTEDRRRLWVALTDAGRERLVSEALSGQAWLSEMIASRLSIDERRMLDEIIPVLRKISAEESPSELPVESAVEYSV